VPVQVITGNFLGTIYAVQFVQGIDQVLFCPCCSAGIDLRPVLVTVYGTSQRYRYVVIGFKLEQVVCELVPERRLALPFILFKFFFQFMQKRFRFLDAKALDTGLKNPCLVQCIH